MAFSFNTQNDHEDIYRPMAEMNVTPFIDVMLVLLIIFMVTAPMLAAGMNVDLPKAASAQPLNPQEPVVVSIDGEKRVFISTTETPRAELVARVKADLGANSIDRRIVHIRGDKQASYGDVVGLLDELAAAGITRLSIVTRTAAEAGPRKP